MPQTLLAILALMILVSFSMLQHRDAMHHRRQMVGVEMEVMGNAIASEKLEGFKRVPFDQRIGGRGTSASTLRTSDLTPTANFPENMNCERDNCEDGLEQFNGMKPGVDSFAVQRPDGSTAFFEFEVKADVYYVDEGGNRTAARTMTKRVELEVDGRYLQAPITMKKDFSPFD